MERWPRGESVSAECAGQGARTRAIAADTATRARTLVPKVADAATRARTLVRFARVMGLGGHTSLKAPPAFLTAVRVGNHAL